MADEEIRRVEVEVPMIGSPPRPPLNMNQRLHWTTERKLTRMVRHGVAYRVRDLRLGAARFLVVGLHYHPGDNRRRDPANLQATQKPAVDALVDAGVVPDDTPQYVEERSPRIHSGPGPRRLWLEIEVHP